MPHPSAKGKPAGYRPARYLEEKKRLGCLQVAEFLMARDPVISIRASEYASKNERVNLTGSVCSALIDML